MAKPRFTKREKEWITGIRSRVQKALVEVADLVVKEAQKIIKTEGHVASGDLLNKFRIKRETVDGAPAVRIVNNSPHALVVEFGRRPGGRMPPPKEIRDWLKQRGKPSDPVTVFLVSRGIVLKGIPALRYMSRAFAKEQSFLKSFIQLELRAWAANIDKGP